MAMKILSVLVYYVGGIILCVGLGISTGYSDAPRWYVVLAPLALAACLLGIKDRWMPIKPKSAALIFGGLGLLGAIGGYFYGQQMIL